MPDLIAPYGGQLVSLFVAPEACQDTRAYALTLPSLRLSARSLCDLELLTTGGFSPLTTFMGREDYESVLETMRLANGTLFPIPITLPIALSAPVRLDADVSLCDERGDVLAVMTVREIFAWEREREAVCVYGAYDTRHPTVAEMHRWSEGAERPLAISGELRVLSLPHRYDFASLRLTPAQTRARLAQMGRANVVAFQTRNPLHRAHEALTKRAIAVDDSTLLLHPSVGMTRPGDVDHATRVRTYSALTQKYYPQERVLLALLPLAMRMAGPREAVWHAIIRRNHGANAFIVGRDHAGPGNNAQGKPFYGAYDAQTLALAHEAELGMKMLTFQEMLYLPEEDRYEEAYLIPQGTTTASISGTQVREEYLTKGTRLPSWFTRPEVAEILAQSYPPLHKQGVCLWFTGLSGSGKSTTAEVLAVLLTEYGRQSSLLDGDIVRTHLSKGLGFSRDDRDTNVRRIGFVAGEVVRHGGIAICAAISPYRATRDDVRQMVMSVPNAHFVEVFVNTPLEECERRDSKGMYAKARRGDITGFTGVDDPYEAPTHAEITLDTLQFTPLENAQRIVAYLLKERLLPTL